MATTINTNYFRSQGGGVIAMSIEKKPSTKSKSGRKGKASVKESSAEKNKPDKTT